MFSLQKKDRPLSCKSFVEFYLLEMISYHVHNDSAMLPSERHFLPSVAHLAMELKEYKSEFEEAFALRLRDYLWFAAVGEARHSGRIISRYIPEMESCQTWERYEVYNDFAGEYPPTPRNIAVLKDLFYSYCWGGTFGGESWGKIVDAVALYETVTPSAFIDHCADLQHNGGVAFDKSVYFWSTDGYDGLMNFLNKKFHARSIVFDLPQIYSRESISDMLSSKVIYLMNKLFAVTGKSPYWHGDFRYKSSGISWDLSLRDVYVSDYSFSTDFYEYSCAKCGDGLSAYSEDNYVDEYGDPYCSECHFYCESCCETHTGDPYAEHPSGWGNLCEFCFDDYYQHCEQCDEVVNITDSGLCEDCEEEYTCDNCEDFDEDSRTIINLDKYSHDVYLSECKEILCPSCIKKFLGAGWRIFYTSEGLVMSSDIDKVLEYPYEELMKVHLEHEFTYASLIPIHIKQGGK